MSATASKFGAYTRVDIETASQGKIIVMLFNGAIKRAEEAKRQLEKGKREGVHNNLIRAQEIIAEQATRVGQPFVNQRWLGGLLTNFNTVGQRLARMKELEAENARLKKMYADERLKSDILQEALRKN